MHVSISAMFFSVFTDGTLGCKVKRHGTLRFALDGHLALGTGAQLNLRCQISRIFAYLGSHQKKIANLISKNQ